MRKNIEALCRDAESDPDLWFPVVRDIVANIDGLARPPGGNVSATVNAYLVRHFPNLCDAIGPNRAEGAKTFTNHFRHKGIHEFAPLPPFAIGRGTPDGPYMSEAVIGRTTWRVLNVDRLARDFVAHVSASRVA